MAAVADAWAIAGCTRLHLEARRDTRLGARLRVQTVCDPWDAWLTVRLRTTVCTQFFST